MQRTVLITGASMGIGRAFAAEFARRGWRLVLVARSEAALTAVQGELTARYGVSAAVVPLDLAAPGAPQALYDRLARDGVEVDALVNAAGFGDHAAFLDSDLARALDMMQLNVCAVMALTHLFCNAMRRRGHGRILNVGSAAAFSAGPYMAVYYASKAAVLSFSEAVADELSGSGVTVTALCPGPTASGFAKAAQAEDCPYFRLPGLSTPEAVAKRGVRAMLRGDTLAYHGLATYSMSLFARLLPRRVMRALSRASNGVR